MVETTETALIIPKVEFKDVKIKFDVNPLQEKVKELQKKYEGYIVTEENLKADKTLRADLNKVSKALKETKNKVIEDYNKPLSTFTSQVEEQIEAVNAISQKVDVQIKAFEKERADERREKAKNIIDALLLNTELNDKYKDQFIFDEKLTNDGSWTAKGELKKDFMTSITQQIEQLKQAQNNEEEVARQKEEQLKQKIEMAKMLCNVQSQALGLNTPITIDGLGSIEHLELEEINSFVTSAANRAKERETTQTPPKEKLMTFAPIEQLQETETQSNEISVKRLVLEFTNLTETQSANLKNFIETNNLKVNTLEVQK